MSLVKYFFVLIGLFCTIFFISITVYFTDIKNDMKSRFENDTNRSIAYITSGIKDSLTNNNTQRINTTIETATKFDNFNNITLQYKRFIFTSDALFLHSSGALEKGWSVSDITVDAKDGTIMQINDTYYEFIPSKLFDANQKLVVKFQAMKNDVVTNSISELDYFSRAIKEKNADQNVSAPDWFVNIFGVVMQSVQSNLIIDGIHIGILKFDIDSNKINNGIYKFFIKIFIYSMALFLAIVGIFVAFKKFIITRDVVKPLKKINTFLDGLLENKFKRLSDKDFIITEVDDLLEKVNKVSVKLAALVSEINVNRNMIVRKIATDDLTGLANQKVFELDIKGMFIAGDTGYVAVIKIEHLMEFVRNNGSTLANRLIEDFTHGVLNSIYEFSKTNISFYRFYGSEFAILAKKTDATQMEELCNKIFQKLEVLTKKYNISTSISHIGATPFDKYGTTDTMLKSANDAYNTALTLGDNKFYLVVEDELKQKSTILENSVERIINNKIISVEYLLDTFLMFDQNKLIMQECTPIMFDENGDKIPVGIFINAAEKLEMADKFDKLVVQNVLSYIINNELNHYIAINLSMQSIANEEFLAWLEGQLIFNSEVASKLVFSITSYSAHSNIELFKKFTTDIHRFGSKIILKRYSYSDFKLEELQDMHLDFVRIQKDYTVGISGDREKKHIVKNIISFGESREILVLGDSVKSDDDFNTLDVLGLYATSR